MDIYMTAEIANRLGKFLNTYYWEVTAELAKEGQSYSQRQMAVEIGIEEGALRRMMDETEPVKGMTFKYMTALIQFFGKPFTDEFGFTPPEQGQEGRALIDRREEE